MNYQKVTGLYFSPTGTTEKIIKAIAQGIAGENVEMVDCTSRSWRNSANLSFKDELVIIGVPVYYGRIPEEVIPFLKALSAEKTPAVPVVVYGNREYEDALRELYDLMVEDGFAPMAAGAFIGEHSYSSADLPLAVDRPDKSDLEKARAFGVVIRDKLDRLDAPELLGTAAIPGNVPYLEPTNLNMLKEARKSIPFTPETDLDKCIQCLQCVEACPNQAISQDDVTAIDRWSCMICFACVRICPEDAKAMPKEFYAAIERLRDLCRERKEPEVYL